MKTSPQLLVAAVLIVISLIATASALLGGGAAYAVPTHDLRIVGPDTRTAVITAERATAPLVAELSSAPASNPFSAHKSFNATTVKIPAPPPPRLAYPALPVLPLPAK